MKQSEIEGRRQQLAALDKRFDDVLVKRGGWKKMNIYTQEGGLKVFGYTNTDDKLDKIAIGVVHGLREEIGVLAWAESARKLIELNQGMLLLPCMNKWGLVHQERYSPNGMSVGDTDELYGVRRTPACPESERMIEFFEQLKQRISHKTTVLDVHEDPKDDGHEDSGISYVFAVDGNRGDAPLVTQTVEILRRNNNPLPRRAKTRIPGVEVNDGVVRDLMDGSIDWMLAKMGAGLVLTTELARRSENDPSLEQRLHVQGLLNDAFLGIE